VLVDISKARNKVGLPPASHLCCRLYQEKMRETAVTSDQIPRRYKVEVVSSDGVKPLKGWVANAPHRDESF
jgi:hypothetical protein